MKFGKDSEEGEEKYYIDLSSGQAASLVRGLSEKSRKVLLTIIEILDSKPEGAWLEDIADQMEIELSEIKGVWSGFTRRTRKVSSDPDAELFFWTWNEEKQDSKAELHPTTLLNLRKAFDL